MTDKQWGAMTNIIRSLAQRKIGVSLREVADKLDRPLNIASGMVSRIHRQKELTKAGIHGQYRYFANPEDAKKHDLEAEEARLKRVQAYKERQNVVRAKRRREARAKAREAKGLPPYVKPTPKPKPPKAQKVDLKPRDSRIVLSTKDQDLEKKKAHKAANIVWPEHVKVQVIPTGQDTRFKFIPPSKEWRGQITQDWHDRRLAA